MYGNDRRLIVTSAKPHPNLEFIWAVGCMYLGLDLHVDIDKLVPTDLQYPHGICNDCYTHNIVLTDFDF